MVKELSDGYYFLCKLDSKQEEAKTKVRVVCRNSLSKLSHLDLDPSEDSLLWNGKNKALPLLNEALEKANPDDASQAINNINDLIALAKDALNPFFELARK